MQLYHFFTATKTCPIDKINTCILNNVVGVAIDRGVRV